MFEQILNLIVTFVHEFGYVGLFVMTFLESTFTPIPSEITVVPAGYLVHSGDMHIVPVLVACISGTIAGSYFTYWVAQHFGRRIVKNYGRYFFFDDKKLKWVEDYFNAHGEVSIFTARLIPGLRHVISFPAGLAHMHLKKFFIFTTVGGTLWILILLAVGYFIGSNKELLADYIIYIKMGAVVGVGLLVAFYIWNHRRKKKR